MTTFPPPITYIAVPCELPKGFNINLPAPRLEAIRFFTRQLIDGMKSVTLDTRPVDEKDDRDAPNASKWTTVDRCQAEITGENPVSIHLDMRFMNCETSTTEMLGITEEHRKGLSKALDVVQIQQMTGMGGIWKIDIRLPKHILFKPDCEVEMRVVAECKEDTNGGKRMV